MRREKVSTAPREASEPVEVFEMELEDMPVEIPQIISEEGFEEHPAVVRLWRTEGPGWPVYCVETEAAVYRILYSALAARADKVIDDGLFVKRTDRKAKSKAEKLLVTSLFSPDDGHPYPGGRCSVLLVVKVHDGSVVAAIPGKVACPRSALKAAGFENFSIGPAHGVSAQECAQYLESHGPTSRRTILREVKQYCEKNRISLDDLAAEKRFEACKDTKFGAALWLAWKERLIAPEKIGVSEVGTPEGRLFRIGAHLLLINDRQVEYETCPSISSAEEHMSKLVKELLSKTTT